jgi:L-asparaginase
VKALVDAGVKGLVVAGTGNGTVHAAWVDALKDAQSQGVAVWLTSRCMEVELLGQSFDFPVAPADLNAYKLRISLMLMLMLIKY